jgi:hypothetical protein
MRRRRYKNPWCENLAMLAVIGLLAGALGGLGVGLISQKSSSGGTVASTTSR